MNSYQRFQNRLRGEPVDCPPNFDIFMTFAAHYIQQPLSKYYLDYRVLVEANLAMVDRFHVDILQAISDPYREAFDYGLKVDFPDDGLPVSKMPLLEDYTDLKKLKLVAPWNGKRMSDRLQAIRQMHERSGGEVPVMGWVEGALAEAADLRGVGNLMIDLVSQPDWVMELLEICCEGAIHFARAQVEAGADIIGLGDAVCSQISPPMYRRFALPYEQRIFQAVKEMGAVPRLHICGNTTRILDDMAMSQAQMIDLDWMVDLGQAAAIYGDSISICGNFDPVAIMLQGTPERVFSAVQNCVRLAGKKGFSGAGCEIPDGTPHANLDAQTTALKALTDE